MNLDALCKELRPLHLERSVENLKEIHVAMKLVRAIEREGPTGDILDVRQLIASHAQVLAYHRGVIRLLVGQVDEVSDRFEWVVDLMHHPPCKPPGHRKLLGSNQCVLHSPEFLLAIHVVVHLHKLCPRDSFDAEFCSKEGLTTSPAAGILATYRRKKLEASTMEPKLSLKTYRRRALLVGTEQVLLSTRNAILTQQGFEVIIEPPMGAAQRLATTDFDLVVACHTLSVEEADLLVQTTRAKSSATALISFSRQTVPEPTDHPFDASVWSLGSPDLFIATVNKVVDAHQE